MPDQEAHPTLVRAGASGATALGGVSNDVQDGKNSNLENTTPILLILRTQKNLTVPRGAVDSDEPVLQPEPLRLERLQILKQSPTRTRLAPLLPYAMPAPHRACMNGRKTRNLINSHQFSSNLVHRRRFSSIIVNSRQFSSVIIRPH